MHNPPNPYPKPLDSTDTNWTSDSQSAWNGTVKTGANGTTDQAVPVVGDIAPTKYYNTQASTNGIVVTTANGGTTASITCNGTTLTESSSPGPGKIPIGTIKVATSGSKTVWDARENAWIYMTTIDLKKLAGSDGGYSGYTNYLAQDSDGLLYSTSDNTHPGVRLINGSQIYRSDGLNVVTNDPLYIQGDYNYVANHPEDKVPSAVICDSVDLLSNNWQDSNSNKSLSDRIANATTVDTAFIAGVDTTTNGNYNGGLENYPRLLEDWSSKNLTIAGSFVELWNTQVAKGKWQPTGNYYNPPNRVWSYDTSLASNPPPFTPFAVQAQRGAWWKI